MRSKNNPKSKVRVKAEEDLSHYDDEFDEQSHSTSIYI